jgi:hypothetical protein
VFTTIIVFNKRTANAETFETLPRITDTTINVESVSGSAIGYDEGEGNTDIKYNSSKIAGATTLYDLMEAQGAHTHTDDCYEGHRHTESCYSIQTYMTYYRSSYFSEGIGTVQDYQYRIYSAVTSKMVAAVQITTSGYSPYISMITQYSDNGLNTMNKAIGFSTKIGSAFALTKSTVLAINDVLLAFVKTKPRTGTYGNEMAWDQPFQINTDIFTWDYGNLPTMSNYDEIKGPVQSSVSVTQGLTNDIKTLTCGQTQDETVDCNRVVTSIVPVSPNQTVYRNGSIVTNATATYMDGNTGIVSCTSNYNSTRIGIQTVTLTYSGLIDNAKTNGTKTTTTSINVQDYVTNIVPVIPNQAIIYNGSINANAVITKASGGNQTVPCTVSNFTNTIVGLQTATLTYTGMKNNNGNNPTCTVQVTVQAGLVSITPTVSSLTVYKGENPILTATATYMDTHTSVVTPTNNFNPNAIGTQIVTLSFTDQGMTKTTTCTIVVKPNLTSLTVTANNSSVLYNTDIVFTPTAHYEDGSSKTVTAIASNPYSKSLLGSQTVGYSYTENGITKSSSVNVTVLDYPLDLSVTLQSNGIYQDCDAIISTYTVNFASGATSNDAALNRSDFDNIQIGPKTITYSYELNGVTVSCDKVITIKPDLYDITLDTNTFEIYRGQEPDIKVTANFNISGDTPLAPEEFTITGFDNNIFDRTGTYYTLSYTSKGITISKQVFIRVLPNISYMTVSVPPQTTEGIQIPFSLIVQYEDGINVTITDTDIGGESGSRLSIQGYDISQVGYQDITFQFSEGGRTLTETVNIRVRALINISIPLNMLISINPNISGPGGTISPDITLNNASKEPVIISVQSIVPMGGNELNDVLPTAHPDWTNLGKRQSKDIAIGLNCKNNWLINYLESPLYIAQITDEIDVGQIDKETVGSIELLINHGNSHSEHREFTYNILWHIRLIE